MDRGNDAGPPWHLFSLRCEEKQMMNGMLGMGLPMLIWSVVGILLIVLLIVVILRLLKKG
jgi:hypothetical protein